MNPYFLFSECMLKFAMPINRPLIMGWNPAAQTTDSCAQKYGNRKLNWKK